jgi:hypothetical protein
LGLVWNRTVPKGLTEIERIEEDREKVFLTFYYSGP